MKTETLDSLANVGSKVTAAGATTSVVGTFLLNNLVGIIGLLIALAGYLTNVHYKRKASKRRDLETAMNLKAAEQAYQHRAELFELRKDLMRKGIPIAPPSDFASLPPAPGPEDEDER